MIRGLMRPLLICLALSFSLHAADDFPLGPDSKPQEGIAKGTLIKDTHRAAEISVFPGTEREYTLYLPAGFDKTKPAAFMVFQDGVIYQAPVVFDNLIAKKDIPPLVGVFIRPGVVPAANENALPRFNRSYEYDSITPTYSQFLINELLPAIEAKHGLQFSKDPNQTAIAGNSSGGICAFMVAWHRPDRFRRVFTGVGTYVGIHGADQLPVLVRKLEPKPLRVFLQSGTGDNNLYCGDWWMANQMMERSLTWAGYDVNHAWGEGGHNQKHASQIFPDVMRWLWRDWQTNIEVKANPKGESKWKGYEVFEAGSAWENQAIDAKEFRELDQLAEGERLKLDSVEKVLHQRMRELKHDGCLSPDQTQIYLSDRGSNYITVSRADAGSKNSFVQPFVLLESNSEGVSEPQGMCVDSEGRLYVATALGLQVCDQAGRVNFIIPTRLPAVDVFFSPKDRRQIIVRCETSSQAPDVEVLCRKVRLDGIPPSKQAPIKPAAPKL